MRVENGGVGLRVTDTTHVIVLFIVHVHNSDTATSLHLGRVIHSSYIFPHHHYHSYTSVRVKHLANTTMY